MKNIFTFLIVLLTLSTTKAQDKYYTKTGKIDFNVTAAKSPENIVAVNKSVVCIIDIKTGEIQFSVLIRGFEFERALMMEHFNENYLESEKFPKANFKGSILNNQSVDFQKEGTYTVKVKGKMSIHNETKEIETTGKIQVLKGKLQIESTFILPLVDYNIAVPQIVSDKVASSAKIKVECLLIPLIK